jgi:hypothetical protein
MLKDMALFMSFVPLETSHMSSKHFASATLTLPTKEVTLDFIGPSDMAKLK